MLYGKRLSLWFRAQPETRTRNKSGVPVGDADHYPTGTFLKELFTCSVPVVSGKPCRKIDSVALGPPDLPGNTRG